MTTLTTLKSYNELLHLLDAELAGVKFWNSFHSPVYEFPKAGLTIDTEKEVVRYRGKEVSIKGLKQRCRIPYPQGYAYDDLTYQDEIFGIVKDMISYEDLKTFDPEPWHPCQGGNKKMKGVALV